MVSDRSDLKRLLGRLALGRDRGTCTSLLVRLSRLRRLGGLARTLECLSFVMVVETWPKVIWMTMLVRTMGDWQYADAIFAGGVVSTCQISKRECSTKRLRRCDFAKEHRSWEIPVVARRCLPFRLRLPIRTHNGNTQIPAIIRGVHPALSCKFISTSGMLSTAFALSRSPNAQTQCNNVRPSFYELTPLGGDTSSTRLANS
jgi:hypothetical protein